MPSNKGGSSNGGIIGKSNKASFGKDKITAVNATGTFTTQPGTQVVATMLAGGGGGSLGVKNMSGAGGGGGGVVLHPGKIVCGATSYPVVIGAGGTGGPAAPSPVANFGTVGGNTTAFGLTALGGGKAVCGGMPTSSECAADENSGSGGSGAGVLGPACNVTPTMGAGRQPLQPGDSGTFGFGNRGGGEDDHAAGGTASGGGAGGAGTRGVNPPSTPDTGGGGLDIQPFFGSNPQPFYTASGLIAGGGGAGGRAYPCSPNSPTPTGGGGIGQGMSSGSPRPGGGTNGTANTGGGAGAVTSTDVPFPLAGSAGGSGQFLVKELNQASGVWSMQSQFAARTINAWPSNPVVSPFNINMLVIAGGGAAPYGQAGGGGAGGYRFCTSYAITPGSSFKVTVGAGGTTTAYPGCAQPDANTTSGNVSSFNTCAVGCGAKFESAGGGAGRGPTASGKAGGSGGGTGNHGSNPGGAGNTPNTSPPQGNPGAGPGSPDASGGGGGGAGGAGSTSPNGSVGGAGGNGSSGWPGDCTTRAGGGGGAGAGPSGGPGPAGPGGGGKGFRYQNPGSSNPASDQDGGTNLGGGGGAGQNLTQPGATPGPLRGGNGGSGVVILTYPAATTGAPLITGGTKTSTPSLITHTFNATDDFVVPF